MGKNYLTLGRFRVRISTKHLAPWGYERLAIGGLSFLSRTNDGDMVLASYQPRGSSWHWAIYFGRRRSNRGGICRSKDRRCQWHDHYRLPFGREIRVSRQDYHRRPSSAPAKSSH